MAFNKVILVGNLVSDPELKQTPTGVPVCSFTIAVNRRFAKAGEQQQTDFINIVSWRQNAEFVSKYFQKGKAILICGSLQTRSWVDQNNQKRYTTEVVADEVEFVERKGDSAPSGFGGVPSPAPFSANPRDVAFEEMSADDDLPF
jgi:single-strand DNA-binding protein